MKKLSFIIVCFFVCISTLQSFAETRTITGQVVDEEDMAIIGATVVTSDGAGTITDLDGNFSLNVSDAAKTIEISYMGYKSQTLKLGDKTVFFVRMEADVHTLQEVVAVGYGTQKKINLTGSIENVDMRTLENRALTNASMALQGQVSGVMVVQGSGQAGGDQAQIRIRGISSMENNNSPLVIIDGMEGDINDVDPKDIESMTVMKDASSAAIYGNKAASGVVLITTKRGRGDVFQVDYSFMQSLQEPTRLPEIVNAKEYITLWNEANINDGTVPRYDLDKEFAAYDEGTKASINWYDVYFKRAPMQKHHINIMLSSGNLNTSTSFSYLKQDGMLYGTGYNKFNYRTNIGAMTKNKKIKLDMHISGYRDNTEDNTSASQYVLNKVNSSPPFAPYVTEASDPSNPFTYIKKETADGVIYSGYANYIGYKELGGGKNTIKNRINNNYILTYEPIKGLSIEARYGFYFLSNSMSNFLPVTTLQSDINSEAGGALSSSRAELTESRTETFFQNFQAVAKFEKTFAESHKLNLLAGTSLEDQSTALISTKVTNFVTNVGVLDFGEDPVNPTGTISERRSLSFFGRLNYNYKERYLVEANLRYDGSSRFLKGHRWGAFPSFSIGWRTSQEDFFAPLLPVVSNLKIRASYGLLGNENIYTYYAGYNQLKSDVSYSFEDKVYNAIRLYSFADKNTTWEKTEQANLGLDMSLFSRLNLTFDVYRKRTYDILARVQVTNIIGTDVLPYQNIGEMLNEGWELSLNYNDNFWNDFQIYANMNISGQRNELLSLKNTSQDYVFNSVSSSFFEGYNMIITKVGESYGSYYGYEVERIFQVDDFTWQNNSDPTISHANREYVLKPGIATQSENPRPGDLKFKDFTPDGIINDKDRTIIGKQLPDLMYSFNVGLSWKGIDVSCFFQGVMGGDVYTGGYLVSPFYNSAPLLKSYLTDRWTYENPSTEYQRVYIDKTKQKIVSDYYVQDASYLRLKNIELGYTFPKKWMEKVRLTKLKIYGSVQNAFLWSKAKSFDPEKLGNVVSSDFHPQARIYSIGLNVVF